MIRPRWRKVILHRIDYLLTLNGTHLANASLHKDLMEYCMYHSLHVPIICAPEALTEEPFESDHSGPQASPT